MAISGELCAQLRLTELIDAELGAVGRVAPVKMRRRGLSPGEVTVAIAEASWRARSASMTSRICVPIGRARACERWPDAVGADRRQLAYRFRARVISARSSGRWRGAATSLTASSVATRGEDVTFDLDATETPVYGRRKQGAGRSRNGHLAYNSYVVTWAAARAGDDHGAQRRQPGQDQGVESDRMLGRAKRLLPAEHGQITVRGDNGFYSVELMMSCRQRGMRFTFSATRTSTMWSRLHEIAEDAWEDAIEMRGAQVAEIPFTPEGWKHEPLRLIVRRVPVTAQELLARQPKGRRRKTIPPEQLQMVLDGQLDSTYAYSFIVTDIPANEKSTAEVEHFHRQRAQIEERFKDAKLGQALRHLPSGKLQPTACGCAARCWH